MDPRRAVALLMPDMDWADVVEKATVGRRPGALGAGSPVVVAAVRDFEHAAHETHRPGARMLLDEGERHLGISAKMPIAFLGRRAPCASGRVHAADGLSRPPGLTVKQPGSRMRLPVNLLPAAVGSHLSAPCATASAWRVGSRVRPRSASVGRPLLSSRATASRLNSGVNSRLVFAIKHLPRPQGAYQRCPWNRGRINGRGWGWAFRRASRSGALRPAGVVPSAPASGGAGSGRTALAEP